MSEDRVMHFSAMRVSMSTFKDYTARPEGKKLFQEVKLEMDKKTALQPGTSSP